MSDPLNAWLVGISGHGEQAIHTMPEASDEGRAKVHVKTQSSLS